MKFFVPSISAAFLSGSLVILSVGCTSSPQSGLRTCFDTGGQIVCTQSAVLATADRDVDLDGKPDRFLCADDDDDGHDRDRDRDHSGWYGGGAPDDDHDGVSDDLDCSNRNECKVLQNTENGGEHGAEMEIRSSSLKGGDDATGGHSGGDDATGGHSSGGDATGGAAGGDDHGGSGGGGSSADDHGGDGHGTDTHAHCGCLPPVTPPPPPVTPVPGTAPTVP